MSGTGIPETQDELDRWAIAPDRQQA